MNWFRQLVVLDVLCVNASAVGQRVIHVEDDAAPGGDGTSWATAMAALQDALAVAVPGDDIFVAGGVYRPDQSEFEHAVPGDRTATFRLLSGVSIYGGFAGTANPKDPYLRALGAFTSALSGDLAEDDGVDLANTAENSLHVVTGSGVDVTALIQGFTITAGNANGESPDYRGGGMLNIGGHPVISACTFEDNYASVVGGALSNLQSDPVITLCTFQTNRSDSQGAAVHNESSSPTFTACHFYGNDGRIGGAMSNRLSPVVLTACTFTENNASLYGGAIYNSVSHAMLSDCEFDRNSSFQQGGAVVNAQSDAQFERCTFRDHTGTHIGGAVYNDGGNPQLTDCIFRRNAAVESGGAIHARVGGARLLRCTFEDNSATLGAAVYRFSGVFSAVDCTFRGNAGDSGGAAFEEYGESTYLRCGSYGNRVSLAGGALHGVETEIDIVGGMFTGNTADSSGGGVSGFSSRLRIDGCTLSANHAQLGGGINGSGFDVYNSILWGNTSATDDPEAQQIGREANVWHSCVQGLDLYRGNGNVANPPLFFDADGPDNQPGTPDDDLRLLPDSPCIDAGDNRYVRSDTFDLDGDGDLQEPLPLDFLGNP